jgi:chorismate dehydratase
MTVPPIRIGAVHYLNTKPLVFGLGDTAPHLKLAFDLPSRLADGLRQGRYDVALIPSIELFREPSYRVISDACIGCRGPVLSVKLFFRRPAAEVRTIALDEGSRTSAALVQILLDERYGLRPQWQPLPIGASLSDSTADAVLLIGDRAIHSPAGSFAEVWDLGDQWCRWSGLPFVFALWVARADAAVGHLDRLLGQARDAGVENLTRIAREEAPTVGMTVPQCVSYLRDNLHFHLGSREKEGLAKFRRHAAHLGLCPPATTVRLHDCSTPR